jgi:hypothetical protein
MEKPNYYAVIPSTVRYDQNLTANAKLLYGEITCLTDQDGNCFAGNEYFAKLYEVSTVSISKWIAQLISANYITVKYVYKEDTKQIIKRIITLAVGGKEKLTTYITKVNGGGKEKFKDNIDIYSTHGDYNTHGNYNTHGSINNNNNITTPTKLKTKEYAELTTKIYPYFLGLFEGENTVPKTTAQKEKWLDTIEYFKKHYDLKEIYYAVKWARGDDFWRPNVLSVPALKTTAKNGAKKIDNLLAKYKAHQEEQNKPTGMFKIPDATWRLDEHQNVIALRKLGPPINEFVLQQHFTLTPDEINEIRTHLINKL